jgi:hypothetical protein
MEEMKLTKKAYLRHEVKRANDIARYEELNAYYTSYDYDGRKAKERLEELKNRIGMKAV